MKTIEGFIYEGVKEMAPCQPVALTRKQWRERFAGREIRVAQERGETIVYGRYASGPFKGYFMEMLAEIYGQGVLK